MQKKKLLTGGSHGIGKAIVKHFHKNHDLYVASGSEEGPEGLLASHFPSDALKNPPDLSKIPGSLDGLVYGPGSITFKPFTLITHSQVNSPLASHLLDNDIKQEKMAARDPWKRMGGTWDIAALAPFLPGSESLWPKVQVMGEDGGSGPLNIGCDE